MHVLFALMLLNLPVGHLEINAEVDIPNLISSTIFPDSLDADFNAIIESTQQELKRRKGSPMTIFLSTFNSRMRAKERRLASYFPIPEIADSVGQESALRQLIDARVDTITMILRRRIEDLGVRGIVLERIGEQLIRVVVPDGVDLVSLRWTITHQGRLEFLPVVDGPRVVMELQRADSAVRRHLSAIRKDDFQIGAIDSLHPFTENIELTEHIVGKTIESVDILKMKERVPAGDYQFFVLDQRVERVRFLLARRELKRLLPDEMALRLSAYPLLRMIDGNHTFKTLYHLYLLWRLPISWHGRILKAVVQRDTISRSSTLSLEMDEEGQASQKQLTTVFIGQRVAIVIDGELYFVRYVVSIIPHGNLTIRGLSNFEAQALAVALRSGELPAPLRIISEQAVKR